AAHHQAAGDQPRGEVLPLDLVGAVVGDVAEQGAGKERHDAGEEHGVDRVDRPVAGVDDLHFPRGVDDMGHEGISLCGRGSHREAAMRVLTTACRRTAGTPGDGAQKRRPGNPGRRVGEVGPGPRWRYWMVNCRVSTVSPLRVTSTL